jgi:hypothetical protein
MGMGKVGEREKFLPSRHLVVPLIDEVYGECFDARLSR